MDVEKAIVLAREKFDKIFLATEVQDVALESCLLSNDKTKYEVTFSFKKRIKSDEQNWINLLSNYRQYKTIYLSETGDFLGFDRANEK